MDWRTWARSSPTAATAPHLLDLALAQEHASGAGATGSRETLLARLTAGGLEERRELVATFLRERVARILGTAAGKLDLEAAMADLGFDSLMAVELTTVLSMELGVELGVVKLLQGVSLQGLAELILEELKLPERAASAATPPAVSAVSAATASPPAVPPNGSLTAATRQSGEPRSQVGNATQGSASGLSTEPSGPARPTPNGNGAAEYASLDYSRWTGRQRVARLGFGLAWRVLTNLHVEGLDNLPAEGAFLVAANHVSMVDAPLVMTALPRRTIVFAGERLRESPFFNWFLSDLANAIYIKRGAGDMEALQRGLAVLRAGGVLAVGPEGGISQTGALQHGHTGVAYLATQTDVPVVPVAAWGQERLTQQWRRLRRPPVHLRIGSPIRFPAGEPDGLHLRSYTDQIMQAVADLLPPEYRGVYGGGSFSEERHDLLGKGPQ
jgi:1-acyl-sn-glycerol-3-phosphate acyltransferase